MQHFLFISQYGEILDVALKVKAEGHKVLFHIESSEDQAIGDGLIEKIDDYHPCIGEGYIWVFDSCCNGKLVDWLKEQGELVVGGGEKTDELENDRQLGQDLFKKAGFDQPESQNFTDIKSAIKFVQSNSKKLWILKQNGSAPKSVNFMAKIDGNKDLLKHLEDLSGSWDVAKFGKVDFDLMEIVDGTEMAAGAFFNGHDWLRNKNGKVVGFLNFEEKKEATGGLGETCGEMGTTFYGRDEDNKFFKDILLRPEITSYLKSCDYRGVFDINGTQTEDRGYVAFEPTCRFGVPSSSYELIEGLETKTSDLLIAIAKGEDKPISVAAGLGMVMVVAAPPFPIESPITVDDEADSVGEIIWQTGKSPHVHYYNVLLDPKDNMKKIATKSGYILTVTAKGGTIPSLRDGIIKEIKDTLQISSMKYRTDIGARVEEFVSKNLPQ